MAKHKVKRKSKKWIQKTGIAKHKGELHRALGVPLGEIIPEHKLIEASHMGGKMGHRARLAMTLRGLPRHHGPVIHHHGGIHHHHHSN